MENAKATNDRYIIDTDTFSTAVEQLLTRFRELNPGVNVEMRFPCGTLLRVKPPKVRP